LYIPHRPYLSSLPPSAPRIPHSFPTRRSSDLAVETHHDLPVHGLATLLEQLERLDNAVGDSDTGRDTAEHVHENALHVLVTENQDRKSTRLNSSHVSISYAVFCLKKKKKIPTAALPPGAMGIKRTDTSSIVSRYVGWSRGSARRPTTWQRADHSRCSEPSETRQLT